MMASSAESNVAETKAADANSTTGPSLSARRRALNANRNGL
jgi:hypothetical protein